MSKMIKAAAALSVVAGLGVAALPLSSYAATQNVNIQAEVLSSISLKTNAPGEDQATGTVGTLKFDKITPGSDPVEKEIIVTVFTNSEAGYTLDVQDTDEYNALLKDGTAGPGTDTTRIPASPDVYRGSTAWGIKGGLATGYRAIPASNASALPLVNYTAGAIPDPDAGQPDTFTIGVVVAEGAIEQGTYKSQIVFTAMSK